APRRPARPANAAGVHAHRPRAQGDAARPDPAVGERPPRGHEPRRAAPDPPRLLRGAGARAAVVLAAARRAAGPDRLRPGAAWLRDVDGREARPRPRVDRRPVGAPLPPHGRRHGLACTEAVTRRTRAPR